MIVVADTSPLNYLIRLGCAEVLQKIYGRVLVPYTVASELLHADAPAEVRAWAGAPPTWLERLQVLQIDESLARELGAGEREAISLALQALADVLLIDERIGRREAEARSIRVAGTLAVVLQASLLGYSDFPETLKRLRGFGFRASPAVEAMMVARYELAKKEKP